MIRRLYSGIWAGNNSYLLFLGEFEEHEFQARAHDPISHCYQLSNVIHTYYTDRVIPVTGMVVFEDAWEKNTFEENEFAKARDHLAKKMTEKGMDYFDRAQVLFQKSRVVEGVEASYERV